jgi:hypothetical protein
MLVDRIPVSPITCAIRLKPTCVVREPEAAPARYFADSRIAWPFLVMHRHWYFTMRWEQAIVYAVGALMLIGVAGSVIQLYGAAIVIGSILIVISLADGPSGLKVFARDVKRHWVGR